MKKGKYIYVLSEEEEKKAKTTIKGCICVGRLKAKDLIKSKKRKAIN